MCKMRGSLPPTHFKEFCLNLEPYPRASLVEIQKIKNKMNNA